MFASREFSNLAIAVLNECYDVEEKKAQNLLIRELEHWGAATCVLLAVESNNKKFISQTACQTLLNNVWMGHLSLDNQMLQVGTGKIATLTQQMFKVHHLYDKEDITNFLNVILLFINR